MTTIKLRRGTTAQWAAANPVLGAGEPGFETDTGKHKIGDGESQWDELEYFINAAAINASIGEQSAPIARRASALDLVERHPVAMTGVAALEFSKDNPGTTPIISGAVSNGILDGPVDVLNGVPLLASGALDGGYFKNTLGRTGADADRAAFSFETISDGDFEVLGRSFVTTAAGPPRFRLFIDDQPVTLTPELATISAVTIATGDNIRVKITHPEPGVHRRFRLWSSQFGLRSVLAAPTTTLNAPHRKRPRVAVIGTSFEDNGGSSARLLEAWPVWLGARLDVEVLNLARSGAGYVGDGTNTFAAQATVLATLADIDAVVIAGSGNDIDASASAIGDAAALLYAAVHAAHPSAALLAVGMMPRGTFGETSSTAAKVIGATGTAAALAGIPFLDGIGTVDPLPDYTTGAAYAAGARVKAVGSTWRARNAIASAAATFTRSQWEPLSWFLGTGYVGALAGDGNRDVMVSSDGLHPTTAGCRFFASRLAPWIRDTLAAIA